MPAQILNGKILAAKIQQDIANRIYHHTQRGHRPPGLAVILVGEDSASKVYIRHKHIGCQKVGIRSESFNLPSSTTQESLIKLIDKLNDDLSIDGILVQLPLPSHLINQEIIERIRIDKDVDGFHPYHLGRLAQGHSLLRPCTPAGIMTLLKATEISLRGLNATVIGVSNIVGLPMFLELLLAGCTVTACHRQTRDLKQAVLQADLLVVAVGSPGLIKGNWIRPGAIVIDVGMNRMDNGHFIGDVEFEEAKKQAAWITPVPGGVGPMTVATLLQNTLQAYETFHLKIPPSSSFKKVSI